MRRSASRRRTSAAAEPGKSMRTVVAVAALTVFVGAASAADLSRQRGSLVDERSVAYRGVRMGDSARRVRRVFGRPMTGDGFSPAGKLPAEIGVPASIPTPGGRRPLLLKYADVAFLVGPRGVYAFIVAEKGARTRRRVHVGDRLGSARRAYRLRCGRVTAGEKVRRGYETYPSCWTTIERRVRIWFGDDPIRSITLLSFRHLRVSR